MSALWAMFIGIGLSLVRGGLLVDDSTPAAPSLLLLEIGDDILLENGTDRLLLE